MNWCEARHCPEKHLLMYSVGDESPAFAIAVARHVEQCRKFRAVFQESNLAIANNSLCVSCQEGI